jgi:hypothetical protein
VTERGDSTVRRGSQAAVLEPRQDAVLPVGVAALEDDVAAADDARDHAGSLGRAMREEGRLEVVREGL